MSEPALILTGITKRLPSEPARRGLSSTLTQLAYVAGLSSGPVSNKGPTIVENVNLTLRSGEIALLVGPPGCGKTSLLRIAAGSMRPTAGVVRVEGGSESLIDPRSGWHSALTARENLVLHGLATGLSVSESQHRCERIASFAEIDGWLDRPVQDYPDAMLTRLAFGALSFLGARVLIWDDVLERRDPLFRQKCLALIPTLLREGKAILMATHDVGKAEEISPRAIWMEEGRVRADGATHDVLARYLEPRVTVAALDPPGASAAVSRLASVGLLDRHGQPATCYFSGDPIGIAIELELTQRVELPYFLVSIAGAFGPIAAASMFYDGCRPPFIDGRYPIKCTFENLMLAPKQRFTVRFAVYASDGTTVVHPKQVIASFVTGGSAAGCGFFHTLAEGRILGGPPVLTDYKWRMPGGIEKAWTSEAMARESTRQTAVEGDPNMTLRSALRRFLPLAHGQASDAPDLLAQFKALMATAPPTAPASGKQLLRVGIASFGAGVNHLVVDSLLAHALQRRGAVCQLLLCDMPELPGCDERFVGAENNHRCQGDCISAKLPCLEVCGLDWVRLSAFLDDPAATVKMAADLVAACPDHELTRFEYEGWKLGEWLGSSVASFLRGDSHGMDPEVIQARRRYLVSGLVALLGSRRWIDTWRPDILMVISGRHIFWRAAREVAQARGIKVVSREMFIESFDCHIYAVNSSCEDPAIPNAWAQAREMPLTPDQEETLDENLRGLPAYARQVAGDPVLEERPSAIRSALNLSADRRLLALFTNVSWDLFVAERDFAFDGQMKWIAATFDFVRRHPELDLVVRAHPAEIVPKFQTRGRIVQQIEERFAPLPPNVRLIGPESTLSSNTLRSMACLNLVYCSSVGMEAIIAGQPVLICGNPYYARKGFSINVDSPDQYDRLLEDHAAGKPPTAPPQSVELARRFLYLFKFRYGIRMGLTSDDNRKTTLKIQDLRELEPGVSLPLDTACDGILHRDEILLPA